MRFKLLTASLALLISQTALATPAKPSTCPSVDAFKNTGISSVMKDKKDGTWSGVEWKNHFGTENEWTFGVGNIKAGSASEALSKSNAAIAGLVFSEGPIQLGHDQDQDQDPMWMCVYSSQQAAVGGVAITPAMTPEISKLSTLMQRR